MLRTASQRIAPAVVNVDTTGEIATWRGWREVGGRGSGVIISADGYVVTNNHVVRIQRQIARDIFVTLQDGRRFRATVLGTDAQNDIALLKIDGKNLPIAQLGDSDRLQVGDWVIAVGKPVRAGHDRDGGDCQRAQPLAGGSRRAQRVHPDRRRGSIRATRGGALADSRGRLIGINTAIYSPVGANVGIGFAIPVNRVKQVIKEILEHGSVGQAWLGISYADISDPQIRRFLQERLPEVRFPANGMFIDGVMANSPARSAGIQPGDVLVELNGRPLRSIEQMQNYMRTAKPGQKVTLRVWRDGRTFDLTVTLGVRPEDMP
jgi:serine protease Do